LWYVVENHVKISSLFLNVKSLYQMKNNLFVPAFKARAFSLVCLLKKEVTNTFFFLNLKTITMKKFSIFALLLALSAHFLTAQTGNVGIGTNNPGSKLDVAGDFKVTQTIKQFFVPTWPASGKTIIGGVFDGLGNAPQLRFQGIPNGGFIDIGNDSMGNFVVSNKSDNAVMTVTQDGKVGIGTTTPSTANLVIKRGGTVTGLDMSSSDSYADMRVIRNTLSTLDKDMFLGFGGAASSKLHLYSAGVETMTILDRHVGINGAAPNATLTVVSTNTTDFPIAVVNPAGATLFYIEPNGNSFTLGSIRGASKSFVIDHPLDPANKVLTHISIESPDAYNLYQGMVVLDATGQAWVELPTYYEALNKDSRYQLTCVGGWAQVYIADEVNNNRFHIAGGKPNMKVSWQVTGTRHDPWMRDNKPATERLKKEDEVNTYFYPKGYGQPEEKGFGRNQKVEIPKQK
jgi:hypothetical protein